MKTETQEEQHLGMVPVDTARILLVDPSHLSRFTIWRLTRTTRKWVVPRAVIVDTYNDGAGDIYRSPQGIEVDI